MMMVVGNTKANAIFLYTGRSVPTAGAVVYCPVYPVYDNARHAEQNELGDSHCVQRLGELAWVLHLGDEGGIHDVTCSDKGEDSKELTVSFLSRYCRRREHIKKNTDQSK